MSRLRVHAWPAPVAAVETLLAAAGPGYVWGESESGLGAAATIVARGATRFADVRDQARALFARVDAEPAHAPRLFGGFAFATGACRGACWREFADARFVLPRWRYVRDAGAATATLALALADDEPVAHALGERDHLLALLARPPATRSADAREREQLAVDAWRRLVDEVGAAIARGACEKIVVARAGRLTASAPFDVRGVLARLALPLTTRFALRAGDTCFVGASPERLVELRGADVRADALAGSAATATVLLASAKDRHEHELVVAAVAASLAPLCAELDVPRAPELRALREVVHLHTPVTGVARAGVHVLDLVAALHPTPAVAGVPTHTAVDWIARREPAPRGWYAGPIGWLDGRGDGSFVVALRSGVLDGDSATIFAGAGIVAGSHADAEYVETALKQRALASALGAPPAAPPLAAAPPAQPSPVSQP